jgi:hypothetical protein
MSKPQSITIADVSITIDAGRLNFPAAYLPFASSNHEDIRIALQTGTNDLTVGVQAFDSPPFFSADLAEENRLALRREKNPPCPFVKVARHTAD